MRTPGRIALLSTVLSLAVACDPARSAQGEISMDQDAKAAFAAIQDSRVYFGHQSVGGNILRELQAMVKEEGLPGPAVTEFKAGDTAASGIVHAFVGENNRPDAKCEDFVRSMEQAGGRFDAAVLKFCYVDLHAGVDPEALVGMYAKTVEKVRARFPDLAIVHVTVPLKSSEGLKSAIRKVLGKGDADADNVHRNRYNELLAERFKGEPIFDLAGVESTRPDGSRETFSRDGRTYYRLAKEYTDDGGHLNRLGGRLAAKEFARTLAGALKTRSASVSAQKGNGSGG